MSSSCKIYTSYTAPVIVEGSFAPRMSIKNRYSLAVPNSEAYIDLRDYQKDIFRKIS